MSGKLDIDFVRQQFPALNGSWTFLDNAGGTQTVRQVGERINDYLFSTNVQLGASYEISRLAGERMNQVRGTLADWMRAADPSEVILGSSATMLLQNLSRSLGQILEHGDEVIVTDCDHEANIGPWVGLARSGVRIRTWKINTDTLRLELEDLRHLMSEKTRLVAFTHASNILGTIHPVREFTSFIHDHGALVCVDGVAYAPHRMVDVREWDVDFYVFSFYKVFGPHYSVLYGKRKHLQPLPGINHYFIGYGEIPYKLQPGNVNFELSWGLMGVMDYFRELYSHHVGAEFQHPGCSAGPVFDLFAAHEEETVRPLIDYLVQRKDVRLIGEPTADRTLRVPTVSFVVKQKKSSRIPPLVDEHRIGIRWGDFYARRLIESLRLDQNDGVVRISLVHYNTAGEIARLIEVLEKVL
ncbi:MAG: aminotransferase class V-fold PLP-dependent enzyme [Bacteroidales bacterium]|nr:aminotransferase class V-fold PLP-dependent enzyme [Bacteroidales bacterium]